MTGVFLLSAVRCDAQIFHRKKKVNKSTSVENTAEPDKILYDKAIEDVRRGRHEVGRLNLQTLINTYPDSEYLAKAKLSIADSFYKEGGIANRWKSRTGTGPKRARPRTSSKRICRNIRMTRWRARRNSICAKCRKCWRKETSA